MINSGIKVIALIIILQSFSGCLDLNSVLAGLGLAPDPQIEYVLDHNSILVSSDTKLYKAYNSQDSYKGYPIQIAEIDMTTKQLTNTFGTGQFGYDDGMSGANEGAVATFNEIEAMVFLPGPPNRLLIGDYCLLREINLSTTAVTTLAGSNSTCSDLDGTGTSAQFNRIVGLAVSGTTLFVATSTQVKRVDLNSYTVTSFAGSNTAGDLDGVGTLAAIQPMRMTIIENNLYILDANSKIKRISIVDGTVTTLAGQAGLGSNGSVDGNGTAATFNFSNTHHLTSDGLGFIFWTEEQKIRKMNIFTQEVKTIIDSSNMREDINSSSSLGQAKVFNPSGILFSNQGLYISNEWGIRLIK